MTIPPTDKLFTLAHDINFTLVSMLAILESDDELEAGARIGLSNTVTNLTNRLYSVVDELDNQIIINTQLEKG